MTAAARRLGAALFATLCLGSSRVAVAGEAVEEPAHPPVYLRLDPCVPVQIRVVRQTLAVEVGATSQQVDAPAAAVTQVSVECTDAQIWLRVEDPRTGRAFERHLDLWTVDPSARARLLGLAIAELLTVSWTELFSDDKSREPLPALSAQDAAVRPTRSPPTAAGGSRLVGVAAVSGFFSGGGLLSGGGLRLGYEHGRHLGWAADMMAQHGEVVTRLGTVSIDAVSTSGALVADFRLTRLGLHVGGGFRGGLGYLAGQPLQPELVRGGSLLGLWGGPMFVGSVSIRLPKRLVVEAQLESGYALFSLIGHVSASPTVGLEGIWVGGQIGIGLLP